MHIARLKNKSYFETVNKQQLASWLLNSCAKVVGAISGEGFLVEIRTSSLSFDNAGRWLLGGERNVTLASKRKMSQRQKSSRSTRSTQTELASGSSSSWSLLDAAAAAAAAVPVNGVDLSLSYAGVEVPMSPAGVPPASSTASSSCVTLAVADSNQQLNGEFYEDAATLFDKLVKAEEVRRRHVVFSDSTC